MADFIRRHMRHIIAGLCAAAVIIICCSLLFTGGGAGLSDNGDFRRVLDANGLTPADTSYSRYLFKRYYIMSIDEGNVLQSILGTVDGQYLYKSPHFTFIKISKLLSCISNLIAGRDAAVYDIFWLGALYMIILAAGAYLIVYSFKKPFLQICGAAVFLLMFCDSGHLLYFNSLYGEALQFTCLTLIMGLILLMLGKELNTCGIIVLMLAIYYFSGSKLANIPLGLLTTAALFIFLPSMSRLHKWVFSISGAAVAISLVVMFVSIPSWMNEQTTYQSVFFGILKESPTPEEDLSELGLPTEYAPLAGTHAYMDSYPTDITSEEFRSSFYEKTGKADALFFYIKHPVRFFSKASEAIRECVAIGPVYLGTSPHKRMGQTEKFSLWSSLRGGESPFTNPFFLMGILLVFAAGSLFMVIYFAKKRKITKGLRVSLMLLLLAGGIWANLILPVVCNGEADLLKHMYLFIHLTDVLLYLGVMRLASGVPSIFKSGKRLAASAAVIAVLAAVCFIPHGGGETILMGKYQGKPVEWLVASRQGSTVTLISKDVLFTSPFDTKGAFGSNLWEDSDIRKYLNGEFLEIFTPSELSILLDTPHEVTLSHTNAHKASAGIHAPYWRASRLAAADMYEESWRHTLTDKVRLPDLKEYSMGCFRGGGFYLIDPYGSSDSMVRYLDKNGVPIYTDAADTMGIRPVITIERTD